MADKSHCYNVFNDLLISKLDQVSKDFILKKAKRIEQINRDLGVEQAKTEINRLAIKELEELKIFQENQLRCAEASANSVQNIKQKIQYQKNIANDNYTHSHALSDYFFDVSRKANYRSQEALVKFRKDLNGKDNEFFDIIELLNNESVSKGKIALKEKLDNDIRKEMWEINAPKGEGNVGITNNKDALFIANTINEHLIKSHESLNMVGTAVKKRYYWAGRQQENKEIFAKENFESFWSKYGADLDMERMGANDMSSLQEMTRQIFHLKQEGAFENTLMNMQYPNMFHFLSAKELQSRTLQFKNVETEIRYNKEYNKGQTFFAQAQSMVQDEIYKSTVMRYLGPDVSKTVSDVLDKLSKEIQFDTGAKANLGVKISGKDVIADGNRLLGKDEGNLGKFFISPHLALKDLVEPKYDATQPSALATVFRGMRSLSSMASLGGYLKSTIVDPVKNIVSNKNAGIERNVVFDTFDNLRRILVDGVAKPLTSLAGSEKFNDLRREVISMGFAAEHLMGELSSHYADSLGNNVFHSLERIYYKFNGSVSKTLSDEKMAVNTLMYSLGGDIDKKFSELSPLRREFFRKNEIGAAEWDLMREKLSFKAPNGAIGISLEELKNIQNSDVKQFAKEDFIAISKLEAQRIAEEESEIKKRYASDLDKVIQEDLSKIKEIESKGNSQIQKIKKEMKNTIKQINDRQKEKKGKLEKVKDSAEEKIKLREENSNQIQKIKEENSNQIQKIKEEMKNTIKQINDRQEEKKVKLSKMEKKEIQDVQEIKVDNGYQITDRNLYLARQEFADKINTMFRKYVDDIAGRQSNETRILKNLGTKSNTVAGEYVRNVTQFLGYPLEFTRAVKELLENPAIKTSGKAGVAAQMVFLGTTLGLLKLWSDDLASGKTPRDLNFESIKEANLYAGSLSMLVFLPGAVGQAASVTGVIGDKITIPYSKQEGRNLQRSLFRLGLGPGAMKIYDPLESLATKNWSKLADSTVRIVPGNNHFLWSWYTNQKMINMMINQKSYNAKTKYMKKRGQKYYIPQK